jgi:glycosyltransferase involved in cell wall biosynthesis
MYAITAIIAARAMLEYAAMLEAPVSGLRIVVNGTFWPQPYVGSGQYLRNLLEHLVTQTPDHRFAVVVPRYLQTQRLLHPNLQTVYMATPFDRRSPQLAKLWFEQISIRQACRSLRADLLHVPYIGAPANPRLPTVVTVHDLIPLLLPPYRTSRAMRSYMRLMKQSMQRAQALIAVSEYTKQDMRHVLDVPEDKIVVTYQSVAAGYRPQPQATIDQMRSRLRIDAPYIYYIGGFDVRKNVATAIKAFARAKHKFSRRTLLAIGGRLPTEKRELYPDIHRVILEQDVAADVVLLGAVSEADNAALMSGCEAFVFPSEYEGFGLSPLEAMRCGAPVLASSTTSVGEVVADGGLLLPPDDIDAWAAALVRMLGDETLRAELRQRGLERARCFSWEATAQKTLEAYARALER